MRNSVKGMTFFMVAGEGLGILKKLPLFEDGA